MGARPTSRSTWFITRVAHSYPAFRRLLTLANLPINRFAHFLERTDQYDQYLQLLEDNFNAVTVPELMCRHLLSVDWLGKGYDCDFNQMLDISLPPPRAP